MAALVLEDVKKIVEKNMRDIQLFKDDYENSWKDTVEYDDGTIADQKNNLKVTRDFLAQTILDVLTSITVSGTLSEGNNQGSQTKSGNNG